MKGKKGLSLAVVIVGFVLLSVVGFWLWQLVWNAVVFGIFGLWRPLSFWEAALVWMLLMAIGGLFKSSTTVRR